MGQLRDSLLLVQPVCFRSDSKGAILVERQAGNGMDRWADNFERLVVAAPMQPTEIALRQKNTMDYFEADQLLASRDRIELVPLPWGYSLRSFLGAYRQTRALLADKIRRCEYLTFAIGGLVGDWASVAALEAIRQRRPYAIWTDRVEHRVVRNWYRDERGPRRAYGFLKNNLIRSPAMKRLEHFVMARCDLGLLHGRDCFEAYSPYCRNAHIVHDIHLKPQDRIEPARMQQKLERIRGDKPLRLAYAGRVMGMKGPLDWVRVMADLKGRGLDFRASWIGDGPMLTEVRDEVVRLGLGDRVDLPGFVGDRARLLESIREADLFVFCHKTPESPRCLIEALMSGTPIVGYDSPYPRDLVENMADRLLVPLDDVAGLAGKVAHLAAHRDELAAAAEASYECGAHFSDEAVFQHRSDLIKKYLAPAPQTETPASQEKA